MRSLHCLALLALPLQLLAADDMDVYALSDSGYAEDLPIVLSATRLEQPLSEAPVAMTVIGRDMIEASGARNIPDLLRLVPGMQVGYFDGNSPAVAYHGHSGEFNPRLQVLIDGRSVYNPARNAVPWSDLVIGLDDIERIEVIRGPNAATFGNNSYFAVISIITRHAIESQGQRFHFRAGSHATTDASYTFGDRSGALDYRITVTSEQDNGTDDLRDETDASSFNYRLDWQAGNNDRVMYQGGYKRIHQGDHEAVEEDPLTGHTIENRAGFQLIKWEHLPQTDRGFSLQYYYNLHDSLEVSPPQYVDDFVAFGYDAYNYVMDLYIKSERHDIEFNQFLLPTENLRLVWGSSARLDRVEGTLDNGSLFNTSSRQELELYRGFAHGEWSITPDWLLNAGYMVESNDISGNDRSPRVGLIYHMMPHHTLRLSRSKATRTPTLFEEDGLVIFREPLTSNGGGPPTGFGGYTESIFTRVIAPGNLSSEKITSTELGYIGEYLNNKLTVDITAFRDETGDLLRINYVPFTAATAPQYELNSSGLVESYENGLATIIRGIELSLDYRPEKHMRAYVFYSHLNIESTGTITDTQLDNSAPEDSGGVMLTRRNENQVDTSLMIYRVEDFDWLDRTGEDSAEAYTKLDVRLAKTWQSAREQLTLALTGQNLLGTFYDFNRTNYNPDGTMARHGSAQDPRWYIELVLKFN